ncbi:MAG: prepilin-type N-terminal cleavage/methylation domain-containing protein [Clostridiales bacterium]|nr:prepilin-type N-terminal cleavage/methylation domain-containing protein [Clostridiales bacterium]MDY5725843.1 prepilin-type N-terminal cleavage/methylation domain-containing protein [Eubacteriales bacterium]
MMKRSTEKGFTVVELVIVVAVIAILAAVLVPTFSEVVRNAKVSKDVSLCKNINIALAAQEATDGKPKRASDAIGKILNDGFVLNRQIPAAEGCYVVYDLTNNRFALLDNEFDIVYSETEISNNLYLLTGDQNTIDKAKLNETYSFRYLITTNENLTLDNSFDAGLIVDCNVTLKTDNTECFIFTDGGNIVINAPQATITHVGNADTVTVDKVSGNSYHVQGTVNELILRSGRVVVEGDSVVDVIVIPEDADDYSIFVESADEKTNQGEIGKVIVNAATQEVVVKDKNSGVVVRVYYPTLPLGDTDKDVVFVYKSEDIKGDGVYKLMNDIEGSLTVSADETVVIDLNGKNFKTTGTIVNNGTATIKNGTITRVTDYGDEQYCVENHGNLTLSDLTVLADSGNSPDSALIFNGNANETKATLTIKGGSYSTYGTYTVQNESGNTVINGGEFKCQCSSASGSILYNNDLLTVNDGKFISGSTAYVIYNETNNVTTVLNGGEYVCNRMVFRCSNAITIVCGMFTDIINTSVFNPLKLYGFMATDSYYLRTGSDSVRITTSMPTEYQAIDVYADGAIHYYTDVNDLMGSVTPSDTVYLYETPTSKKVLPLNSNTPFTVYLANGAKLGSLSFAVMPKYEIKKISIETPEGFDSATRYIAVVSEASANVKIIKTDGTTEFYINYSNANDNAKNGDIIVLLNDVNVRSTVSPDATCVIDLNGHTLCGSENKGTIYPSTDTTITIKDSVGGGKVINKAKTPYAVNACDGSVIIEGGIFEGLISGNVVIKGGTFSENPNLPDTAEYEAKENVDGYWVVVKKES